MKKSILLFCIFLFCIFLLPLSNLSVGAAQNPFTSKPGKHHKTMVLPVKSKFFVKIVFWQQQLRGKMSQLIREATDKKKIAPLLLLTLTAFVYGVVHSAGPGHGKAVALSYILSCKPSLHQSLIFGNLVAITHGISGIMLVLSVKYILHTSITHSLENMTHITQIISFSLITLIGLIIFTKSLFPWFSDSAREAQKQTRLFSNPFATALAVGMVPCPGVVMVMLFAISLNLTGLGIILGICIAAGMASTITLVVLAGMSGKAAVLRLSDHNSRRQRLLGNTMESISGLIVASLGFILLLANF
jgi:ABC-type nickel/cobalt efflux system permease component RcnA